MSTLFVNRLTVLDFSYLHPDRGLVGESWHLDVELTGGLDHQGMVLDFGDVKRQVKHHSDAGYDHKLMVPASYRGCSLAEVENGIEVTFATRNGEVLRHRSPSDALCIIDAEEIGPDSVTTAMTNSLRGELPDSISDIRLRLYPEVTRDTVFHYSHGLKQHAGNCQRIAHGHRSRIQIFKDGEREHGLELEWAERWQDIYIGTRGDLVGESAVDGILYHDYAYHGSQGSFDLRIPAAHSYLIECASTIENLAQHMADRLKAGAPAHQYEVRAFEGIDKGAVGIA